MASTVYIPFNYQPISTSVKTSSYTVPAGKYGALTVIEKPVTGTSYNLATNASGTKNITESECMLFINSVASFPLSFVINSVITSTSSSSKFAAIQMPVRYGVTLLSIIQVASTAGSASGAVYTGFNGVQLSGGLNSSLVSNGNYSRQDYANGFSGTYTSTATHYFKSQEKLPQIWLTSGDVISGPTGCQFIFTEYNAIA